MDKQAAQSAVNLVQEAGDALNKLTIISMQLPDKEEQIEIRKYLGSAMISLNDLLRHIVRQYSDLDPDRKEISE